MLVDEAAVGNQRKFVKIFVTVHRCGNRGVEIGAVCTGDASLMMKIICSYFFVKTFHKAPPDNRYYRDWEKDLSIGCRKILICKNKIEIIR